MFRIKRLYTFILGDFLPLLAVTFCVCLFILLMQFLWKYVDDMVGKGIDLIILAKMFFYAALYLVPMTLPLAILLASLMTFGNLGEHMELLAIKAAGVSLLRIMRPIIISLIVIAGGAFYFQNNVLPITQVKLWTIVASMKQKSPELDIPEGSFYKEISGYNVYVRHKDRKGGMMRDMMIYDFSKGFENAMVIVADSGKLKVSEDKQYLVLTLYSGESFENMVSEKQRTRSSKEKIPYRRETFSLKEILITFATNFKMADESLMQGRDVSKNMNELRFFIDSVQARLDTVNLVSLDGFRSRIYKNTFSKRNIENHPVEKVKDTVVIKSWNDYFAHKSLTEQLRIVERAKSNAETIRNDYFFTMSTQSDQLQRLRGHQIEWHRKLTLSLACLVFFFIGGPLGAIIRKGGLGMPAVLSVILFLSYYTIDIFGLKMAKQGVWPVWQGMWMSSIILIALGAFLTYKAVNDSVMMNPDVWKDFFRRFFGKKEVRNYQRKEVIITPPDYTKDIHVMTDLNGQYEHYLENHKKAPFYSTFWKKDFNDDELKGLIARQEQVIEDLRNSEENLIIGKLMDYPVVKPDYPQFLNNNTIRWICAVFLPVGLLLYLGIVYKRKQTGKDLVTMQRINNDLKEEITKLEDRINYV